MSLRISLPLIRDAVGRLIVLAMEKMRLHQVTRAFRAEVCQAITNFSIGLIKLDRSGLGHNARLGGSGTLVQIGDNYGILTARHVLEYLRGDKTIGLLLGNMIKPYRHRVEVCSDTMRWVTIASSGKESEGPDLAILLLSSVGVGWLRAQKTFYNLLKREWLLHTPPDLDVGVWFLCGFADEATTERVPESGSGRIKVFEGICGDGWVENEYCVGDFGYLDFEVAYGSADGPPQSFGGVSGGGLWQVVVMRTPDGDLKVKELLLSGVAFYQNPPIENRRVIKCHGRDGIYAHAIQRVRKESS